MKVENHKLGCELEAKTVEILSSWLQLDTFVQPFKQWLVKLTLKVNMAGKVTSKNWKGLVYEK